MPEINHCQTEEKAYRSVKRGMEKTSVGKDGVILVYECGKCGESATETYSEQKPPMLAKQVVALKYAVEYPNQQASKHISRKCAPHGLYAYYVGGSFGYTVSCDSA